MSKIKVTLPAGTVPVDGLHVSFSAPCDCAGVTGIVLEGESYALVDTLGAGIGATSNAFCMGAIVSVILDVTNKKAFIQNSASAAGPGVVVSTEKPTGPALWIHVTERSDEDGEAMPGYYNASMRYVDAAGNMSFLYPYTWGENVYGNIRRTNANPIASESADTPESWYELGTCWAPFTEYRLLNQETASCSVISLVNPATHHIQQLIMLSNGTVRYRSAAASSKWDESVLSGASAAGMERKLDTGMINVKSYVAPPAPKLYIVTIQVGSAYVPVSVDWSAVKAFGSGGVLFRYYGYDDMERTEDWYTLHAVVNSDNTVTFTAGVAGATEAYGIRSVIGY